MFGKKSVAGLSLPLFMIFSGSFTTPLQAQETKTLNQQEVVKMALENNLDIKASEWSVQEKKLLKGASWDIPKTSVEGQCGQFNSYTKDNSFTISQTLAFPTVYRNQSRLADAYTVGSEWELKQTQLEISIQVKQVYWQLAYLLQKQMLLAYQDTLFSRFYRAAELRFQSGETNQLELVTARSQSMETRNQLKQLESDISSYEFRLQSLLNLNLFIKPADSLSRLQIPFSIADTSELKLNPYTENVRNKILLAELYSKLEKSHALPDISMGWFSQTMQGVQEVNSLPRTFGPGDRFNGVQAGISVPIWYKPSNAKIKAAKVQVLKATVESDAFNRSLLSQYKQLIQDLRKHEEKLDFYEKQALFEAAYIIEQSGKSYNSGSMDYLDYVTSLSRALSIRQGYLEALGNYKQTQINLEYILGKTF